jgi:anaerobic selenocysteine-containing dehydrogenase
MQPDPIDINPDKQTIRTTCPRDCYDACGIIVVKKRGEITRVMGDPQHPISRGALCGKCAIAYNGAWRDPAARLATPLRRVGAKGDAKFEPIGWDEALSIAAKRLNEIIGETGGHSIIHTHYTGTCSLIAGWFPLRFFHRIGATEVDPDTVCNKAGHVALETIFGDSLRGFDPRTSDIAQCILIWGANPSSSAPHVDRYWLAETGAKKIVIDPIRHPTAARAYLHLQLRPGTDAALAFALLHVLRKEGFVDRQFVARHTLGWDAVEPQLDACTPEWGERVTGVPQAKIIEAARIYGAGPSLLWLGQGLQRQSTGGNVFRACSLLPIATGMIGKPGTGFLYMNGFQSRGIDMNDLVQTALRHADSPAPISHMDLYRRLEDHRVTKALVTWNNNIAASSPNQTRVRNALKRDDLFHVAIDLFPTDTTDFADLILPAASFLEFDDLVLSYFNYSISAQVKATEPFGMSLPNQEIFRRLAGAMGLSDTALFESDADILARLLRQTGIAETFSVLAEKGTVPYGNAPIVPFEDCRFATPSGKIEMASERFVALGLPLAPLPLADAEPAPGRLRLLSPASTWHLNSNYSNDARIAMLIKRPTVMLHPDEAAKRGLVEGDPVALINETGRLPMHVALSDTVPIGVALVHKGRWPKMETPRGNVNILNPGRKTDLAESSAVHSIEVDLVALEKVAIPEPGADAPLEATSERD